MTDRKPDPLSDPSADPTPASSPEASDERSGSAGLIGVVFVVLLALGAIFLVNRMQHWAAMGDCAFTHAPACRELLDK